MSKLGGFGPIRIATVFAGVCLAASGLADESDNVQTMGGLRIELGANGKPLASPSKVETSSTVSLEGAKDAKGLFSRKAAKGTGTVVKLDGRFHSTMYASIGEDGKLKTTCAPAAVTTTKEVTK
jgi:hypothetical protein